MRFGLLGWVVGVMVLSFAGCATTNVHKDESIEKGWLDRDVFRKPQLAAFQAGIDTASFAPGIPEFVKNAYDGEEILVFFGTWCSDSRHHVPRLLKLVDAAGIPPGKVRLYGLDRTKKSDDGLSEKYMISRVPTFIILKDGKEVGRFVETPVVSVEDDIIQLLMQARKTG